MIEEWATGLMTSLGAPGAGLAIALENLFPPLPSEVILPLAGFTAQRGGMHPAAAVLWTTLGSLVGALVLYGLGGWLGRDRMVALAGKLPLVKPADVVKSEVWFARHGTKAVFFGRMIPVFRSLISIPAGVERMPVPLFLLLTGLGSLIWNCLFIVAGYALGSQWHRIADWMSVYSKVVLALAVLLLAGFVLIRVVRRRAARSQDTHGPPDTPPDREPPGE